jgi:glyoxylase-like metal-dependent hydrolase (beta-lactamase superfamily II)
VVAKHYGIVLLALVGLPAAPTRRATLRLIQFTSDSSSYHVGSTLILGPTEAILIDAQMHPSDAKREADSIAALGAHLKAIFITHPDEDHYLAASTFVERFPGTPVYMTAKAIDRYNKVAAKTLDGLKKGDPSAAPDSLVTPRPLPGTSLTVDGETVQIYPDEQGDVLEPTNSFLWIPSLHAVLTDDIVFNKVHPWLAASDSASRQRWHESIRHIIALHPRVVIASHKKSLDTPDGPDILQAMDRYLTDFDAVRKTAPDAKAFQAAMVAKYPDWSVPMLLQYSAAVTYGMVKLPM